MALLHAADWHLTRLRDARLATPGAAPRACGCGILQTDGETPITVTLLFWGLGFQRRTELFEKTSSIPRPELRYHTQGVHESCILSLRAPLGCL